MAIFFFFFFFFFSFSFLGVKLFKRAVALVYSPLISRFISTFSIKSHRQGVVYNMPHFFILNKGNYSGKPLSAPCPNCFLIQFQCEKEKEHKYF